MKIKEFIGNQVFLHLLWWIPICSILYLAIASNLSIDESLIPFVKRLGKIALFVAAGVPIFLIAHVVVLFSVWKTNPFARWAYLFSILVFIWAWYYAAMEVV